MPEKKRTINAIFWCVVKNSESTFLNISVADNTLCDADAYNLRADIEKLIKKYEAV